MSKEESFKEYWNMFGNPDSAIIRYSCLHTWNHQQAKLEAQRAEFAQQLDKANERIEVLENDFAGFNNFLIQRQLESENKQLKEEIALADKNYDEQAIKLNKHIRQKVDYWQALKLAVEVIISIAAEDYTIQNLINHREEILQEMLSNDTLMCRGFLESEQYKKVEGSL